MRTATRSTGPGLATAALALAAVLATACATDPWNDPAIGAPFVPDPRTARRVGRLFEDASPRLVSGSGGASITGADCTHWLVAAPRFGFGEYATHVSYAIVTTVPGDWPGSDGTTLVLAATDPDAAPDTATEAAPKTLPADLLLRWVGGIAVGDDVVLHYAATRPGPAGEPALDFLGMGVARLSPDGLDVALPGGDWRFFDRGEPAFGMAVVQAGHGITSGYDYVFGIRGDAGTNRVYVARVPHGRADEREQYRFFADSDGARDIWSTDVADAAPLFRAGPAGLSVSWNRFLQAFLAVYSVSVPGDADTPDRIRVLARAARHPSGPWSTATPLFEVRGPAPPGRVRLETGAREHAQLSRYDGRILYVSVDGGAADTAPRMWRVELPETR